MKSKVLALSAVSAGLVAIILTVGNYVGVADLSSIVLSSTIVTMPLYLKSYKGSILTALVGGVIAFTFSGFNLFTVVFPAYIFFFGIYPIVRAYVAEKGVKKIVIYVIGGVWFTLTVYGIYFYYTLVMNEVFSGLPQFISDNILYILAPIALLIYFVYDKFIQVFRLFIDRYLGKIIK